MYRYQTEFRISLIVNEIQIQYYKETLISDHTHA